VGPFLQEPSELDRPVQILDDVMPTGNLNDDAPTYGVCSDLYLLVCG